MPLQTLAVNMLLPTGLVGIVALVVAIINGRKASLIWRVTTTVCAMFFFTLTAIIGGILILAYVLKEYHFVVFSLLAVLVGCAVGGCLAKLR